jgi:hypothetical protein
MRDVVLERLLDPWGLEHVVMYQHRQELGSFHV